MISAEPSFPGEESSAEGISLPVFFMACLRSEMPVSHKPQVLATARERARFQVDRSAVAVPVLVHTCPRKGDCAMSSDRTARAAFVTRRSRSSRSHGPHQFTLAPQRGRPQASPTVIVNERWTPQPVGCGVTPTMLELQNAHVVARDAGLQASAGKLTKKLRRK
jgi:hypothetical protein